MQKSVVIISIIGIAALFVATQAFFIVDQTQQAIVLQLGQPKGEARGPGKGSGVQETSDAALENGGS